MKYPNSDELVMVGDLVRVRGFPGVDFEVVCWRREWIVLDDGDGVHVFKMTLDEAGEQLQDFSLYGEIRYLVRRADEVAP